MHDSYWVGGLWEVDCIELAVVFVVFVFVVVVVVYSIFSNSKH